MLNGEELALGRVHSGEQSEVQADGQVGSRILQGGWGNALLVPFSFCMKNEALSAERQEGETCWKRKGGKEV